VQTPRLPFCREQQRSRRTVAEPTAAFGPPGSTGEENISVIAAPIAPGFRCWPLLSEASQCSPHCQPWSLK